MFQLEMKWGLDVLSFLHQVTARYPQPAQVVLITISITMLFVVANFLLWEMQQAHLWKIQIIYRTSVKAFQGFPDNYLIHTQGPSAHTTPNTGEINSCDRKSDQRCVSNDTECRDQFKPNVNQKRILQGSSTLSPYQSDGTIQQCNELNNKSVPSQLINQNLSQKYFPIDFREKEKTKDIYRVFKDNNIDEDQGYTGWSSNVMGLGPFGWSEQLLYRRGTSKVRVFVKKL